jgi:hypothetical protein
LELLWSLALVAWSFTAIPLETAKNRIPQRCGLKGRRFSINR